MSILRYGIEQNSLAFESTWVSPWYVSGQGNVAGLWMFPNRENRPSNWDQCGYGQLVTRTNPNQVNLSVENRIILFENRALFLFPTSLHGNEFRIELKLVDWVSLVSIDWGTVLLEPEENDSLESVLDSLQFLVAVVQALL